jgi:hypothetical protein
MVNRVISTTLGVIGGIVGGIAGYYLFFWILKQNFYAMVLPSASVGLGCGLLARHRSIPRGIVCAIAGLALGLYTEWVYAPFEKDQSFGYLVAHFYNLRPLTLIMIALGTALSYYLGRDAGFLAPPGGGVSSTKDQVQGMRDRGE